MKILTFGDSHSIFLKLTNELKEINSNLQGVETEVVVIHGATVSGFGKRESTLNTTQSFINKVQEYKPEFICFALGQVDIELGYYYKKVVKGEKIDFGDFSSELVDKYINNVIGITNKLGYSEEQIIFKGVNLPVLVNSRNKAIRYTSRIINGGLKHAEAVKLREKLSLLFPSNLERSAHHIGFNEKLKLKVLGTGMKYFDINSFIEAPDDRSIIDIKYVPAGPDHHLINSLYIRNVHLNQLIYAAAN